MKRMGIGEFKDKLFTGKLSRRQALGVPRSMGVVATVWSPRGARAAQQPLVIEWAGNEVPELNASYFAAHGEPEFAFFASEQEMAMKFRNGFPADVTDPCAETNVGAGDDDLDYEFLDAWISPEAGKFPLEEYGYGHSNHITFEIADPEKVAALGFPSNPIVMLKDGNMFQPYDPVVLEKMVNMFDDVKLGL
jgi:hypothetical protein